MDKYLGGIELVDQDKKEGDIEDSNSVKEFDEELK